MNSWAASALPQIGEQIPKLILEGSGWLPSDLEGLRLDCTAYAACGMQVAAPSIFAGGSADSQKAGSEASKVLNRELQKLGDAWQDADADEVAENKFKSAEGSIFDEIIGDQTHEDWKDMYNMLHSPPEDPTTRDLSTDEYMQHKFSEYRSHLNEYIEKGYDMDELNRVLDEYFIKDIETSPGRNAENEEKAPESAFELDILIFIVRFGSYVHKQS